jgi:hypothetical protein
MGKGEKMNKNLLANKLELEQSQKKYSGGRISGLIISLIGMLLLEFLFGSPSGREIEI